MTDLYLKDNDRILLVTLGQEGQLSVPLDLKVHVSVIGSI